jgi:hypothetical protein
VVNCTEDSHFYFDLFWTVGIKSFGLKPLDVEGRAPLRIQISAVLSLFYMRANSL